MLKKGCGSATRYSDKGDPFFWWRRGAGTTSVSLIVHRIRLKVKSRKCNSIIGFNRTPCKLPSNGLKDFWNDKYISFITMYIYIFVAIKCTCTLNLISSILRDVDIFLLIIIASDSRFTSFTNVLLSAVLFLRNGISSLCMSSYTKDGLIKCMRFILSLHQHK